MDDNREVMEYVTSHVTIDSQLLTSRHLLIAFDQHSLWPYTILVKHLQPLKKIYLVMKALYTSCPFRSWGRLGKNRIHTSVCILSS